MPEGLEHQHKKNQRLLGMFLLRKGGWQKNSYVGKLPRNWQNSLKLKIGKIVSELFGGLRYV